ncbi:MULTISPECIES: hypothetical protein [Yersinia pseudotuberculosis complex]|uniref:hypothetical protein n=1 Tax=Yersinia pseudotuberculosis complex TaxID=1649845 RepID=UPI000407D095|nr:MULTISPECIES: hypothetical protein [Yersinia pseudotuberculosis complex]CNB09103.1 Uncharacterised protein [Yersinia similis]CNF45100.1 Uncharacterised protein [Yersinia similis]
MEIKGDFYVLMHSEAQDLFYIETMGDMFYKNVGIFLKRKTVDYIPIAAAATIEELQEIKSRLIDTRNSVTTTP